MLPEDRSQDALIISISTALMGIVAWIGHTLNTANPLPSNARWVGGAIVAGFVAYSVQILTSSTGMEPKVSSIIAAVCGSMGERGLTYLWTKYFGNIGNK